jgi:integrase
MAWNEAAQVYDPVTRRPRQVGTFATKREAMRAEAAAMDQRTATGRETVASFAARWPVEYPRPRASTNVHNAEWVKPFASAYGHRRMDSITVEEARAWALRHPGQLAALRAMFSDARRSGMVVGNPFLKLGIERSRGRRDLPSEWLTADDVERLAQCAREAHGVNGYGETIAGLIVFAAYTGLRPGELYALRHDDLGSETLEVRRAADSRTRSVTLPKNGRARMVVYPAKAREAVEAVPRLAGIELVFPSPSGGQLWASTFAWARNPVRAAFGRPTMALHELRHFCATYLLELGLAPVDVAVQLGHTDGGALVMSTYGHPSERAARARIAAAMDGNVNGELRPFRGRGAS